jgi:SnoaL-like domain
LTPSQPDETLLQTIAVFKPHLSEKTMKKVIQALFASTLLASTAIATPSSDVMTSIRQFVDGFNKGDTKSAFAAYATGDVTIVDEFAPHRWTGPNAAQEWAADYDKHAVPTGVSDGSVKYDAPTRTEIEGDLPYVIVPTVYLYKEHGKAMVEEASATFVLHQEDGAWKIRSWRWTGVKPHPAK